MTPVAHKQSVLLLLRPCGHVFTPVAREPLPSLHVQQRCSISPRCVTRNSHLRPLVALGLLLFHCAVLQIVLSDPQQNKLLGGTISAT